MLICFTLLLHEKIRKGKKDYPSDNTYYSEKEREKRTVGYRLISRSSHLISRSNITSIKTPRFLFGGAARLPSLFGKRGCGRRYSQASTKDGPSPSQVPAQHRGQEEEEVLNAWVPFQRSQRSPVT
ncbi:hypothetical protein TWF225_011694 [Orbilia oligospora]|nr:hypothetical protein TWF225_011694 [Orbilia oligospora]KAF3244115.1 hypothetical protein TWF128_009819 [Orbilia oligospora]KAF3244116.1 hypothetical protein TWF128_009819 [Orbilia oligospora]KAF3244654.1 hypothetical protein TWF217_010701 [Orbilia oligospora]KAF3295418.1 hypothetical protein TWF132_001468 [Orbilia oligospora]